MRESFGKRPAVTRVEPQVEATGRQRHADTRPLRQDLGGARQSPAIHLALHSNVSVVSERDDTRCLCRPGHHHADMLANFFQIVDNVGIARIERHAHTGKI